MQAVVKNMTLVFCPFPHPETTGKGLHCSYMFLEFGDGRWEVWHDPPVAVYDNVYSGLNATRIVHPCARDVQHLSEQSN